MYSDILPEHLQAVLMYTDIAIFLFGSDRAKTVQYWRDIERRCYVAVAVERDRVVVRRR